MLNDSHDSNIILQGVLLTGIKDIKFDSSVNESSTKLLGNQGIKRKIYGPPRTTCSFSKPFNGKDFIQTLTGVTNLSGQFIYKNDALDFTDAVISNYGFNLNEDGFAEVNVTLQIFGDTKPTTNLQLLNSVDDFPVIGKTPTATHFDLDGVTSPIKSFSYQASFKPEISNNIGSINFSNIDFTSLTEHKLSVDIEMVEQEIENITGFLDDSKLRKDVNIVFAEDKDKSSVDLALNIQKAAKLIASSGFKIDDLDFTLGACGTAFQLDQAFISNQDLNSKAGQGINLRNEYTSYTNTEKTTRSITAPNQYVSCSDHVGQLQDNLNTLFARVDEAKFVDQVDFENQLLGIIKNVSFAGNTFYKNLIDFENQSIGMTGLLRLGAPSEDFEFESVGAYTRNNIVDFVPIALRVDFESFAVPIGDQLNEELQDNINLFQNVVIETFETSGIGNIQLDLLISPKTEESFEDITVGNTGLVHLPRTLDYQESFEGIEFEIGNTGLIQLLIPLDLEQIFEDSSTGPIDLPFIKPDFIYNATDFELESVGTFTLNEIRDDSFSTTIDFESENIGSIGLDNFEINDFFNLVDLELESVGTVELNQFFVDRVEIDFEEETVGTVTSMNEFEIDDFSKVVDFESESVGAATSTNEIIVDDTNGEDFQLVPTFSSITLPKLQFNDYFNVVDFESESVGVTTSMQEFDEIDDFFNLVNFELESVGVTTSMHEFEVDNFVNIIDFEDQTIGETSLNMYSL